jgi:hypothetical protein
MGRRCAADAFSPRGQGRHRETSQAAAPRSGTRNHWYLGRLEMLRVKRTRVEQRRRLSAVCGEARAELRVVSAGCVGQP